MSAPEPPIVHFDTSTAWAAWLAEHHADSAGVWLKLAKKGSGVAGLSYDDALDVALCHGWIDGQKGKFDDRFWLQRMTPRQAASKWSQRNCAKAESLINAGAMHEAGLREVERAKADGRWDAAYAGQRSATVPDDLRRALDQNETAREFFATLDSSNRYAILYRIQDAKKPETRARRVAKFVAMLGERKKIHP